eukprot:3655633-Amphidinium_carterae.1
MMLSASPPRSLMLNCAKTFVTLTHILQKSFRGRGKHPGTIQSVVLGKKHIKQREHLDKGQKTEPLWQCEITADLFIPTL